MKFKVFYPDELSKVTKYTYGYYNLPLIEHPTMVPLYIALSGTNILGTSRNGRYAKSGIDIYKYIYVNNEYEVTDIMFTMLYIDKIDHYRQLHKEAIERGDKTIDIYFKDTEKIRYRLKKVSLGFEEQKYLQNVLPSMVGDMISNQMEINKQLNLMNIKIV